MEIKNCRGCGRLFNYIGGVSLCPACKEEVEEKFVQVKEYIENNKNALITQIAEDNDVSIQQLHQWIREERLIFTEDSAVGIECESCGKNIRTGRYCDECKNTMAHNLGNVYKKQPTLDNKSLKDSREKAKMRFLDNN